MSVNTDGQVHVFCQTACAAKAIAWRALKTFYLVDGSQRAGAFAHYAFFSLIPLIILLVTIASFFIDGDQASEKIIAIIKTYVSIGSEEPAFIFGACLCAAQAELLSSRDCGGLDL